MRIPTRKKLWSLVLHVAAVYMGLTIASLLSTLEAKDQFDKEPPVWQIHLKNSFNTHHSFQNCIRCVQIAFLSEDLLAVTFQTSESVPPSPLRNYGILSGPNGYRTVLLDVKTGLVRASHDWTIPLGGLTLIPTHDGMFVAKAANEIGLYSSSFEKLQNLKLLNRGNSINYSMIGVSWDGHSIIVGFQVETELSLQLIDADSLTTKETWTRTLDPIPMKLLVTGDIVGYTAGRNVTVVSEKPPAYLKDLTLRRCKFWGDFVMFVGAGAIAIPCNNQLQVSDLTGRDLLHVKFKGDQNYLTPVTSNSGNLMGLKVAQADQDFFPYSMFFQPAPDRPDKIIIFETKTWQKIYERRVPGYSGQPVADIALSPGDSYMAMLSKGRISRSDGDIQLFRLPQISNGAPVSAQR